MRTSGFSWASLKRVSTTSLAYLLAVIWFLLAFVEHGLCVVITFLLEEEE